MNRIIKKTSIFLLIVLFAICTVMGITSVHPFSAQAADLPVLSHVVLSDNLGGKGLVKGKTFTLTLTITSEYKNAHFTAFDLVVAATTADGSAVVYDVANKLTPMTDFSSIDSNFEISDRGYIDAASGDFLTDDSPVYGGTIRFGYAFSEVDESKLISTDDAVVFSMGFTVDETVPGDKMYLTLHETSAQKIGFENDVKHTLKGGRNVDGLLDMNILEIPLIDETEDNSLASLEVGPAADALSAVDMTVETPTYKIEAPMDQMVVKPVAGAPEIATVKVGVTAADGTTEAVAPAGLDADGTITFSPRPSHGQKLKITVTSQVGVAADYFVDIVVSYARLAALTSDVAEEEGTTLGFQETIGNDTLAIGFAYTLHVPTVQAVKLTPTVLAGYEINETIAVAVTGGTADATVGNGLEATVTMSDPTCVVTLTLTAADGTTTQDYTVTILSADVSITSFTVTGDSGTVYNNSEDQATGNSVDYFFSLDKETPVQGKMAIVAALGATVQVNGSAYDATTVHAKGEYTVTVTAVAGNSKSYTVRISAPEYLELVFGSKYQFLYEFEEDGDLYRVAYGEMEEWDLDPLEHGVNDAHLSEMFVLGQIEPNTLVMDFVANIKPNLLPYVRIFGWDRGVPYCAYDRGVLDEYSDEDIICTGWYIEFGSGAVPSEVIYLSVLGDLNGDGEVDALDGNRVQLIAKRKATGLSIEYRLAGYVNNGGAIDALTFNAVVRVAKRKTKISSFYWFPAETASMASISNAPALAAPMTDVEEAEEIVEIEVQNESRLAVSTEAPSADDTEAPAESERSVNNQPAVPGKKYGYTDWDVKEKTL